MHIRTRTNNYIYVYIHRHKYKHSHQKHTNKYEHKQTYQLNTYTFHHILKALCIANHLFLLYPYRFSALECCAAAWLALMVSPPHMLIDRLIWSHQIQTQRWEHQQYQLS